MPKTNGAPKIDVTDQPVKCKACDWHGDTLDLRHRDGEGYYICPTCGNGTLEPDNALYHNFNAVSDMIGDILYEQKREAD